MSRSQTKQTRRQNSKKTCFQYETLEPRVLLAVSGAFGTDEIIRMKSDVFAPGAVTADYIIERAASHPFVANEIVVATFLPLEPQLAAQYSSTLDWNAWTGVADTFVIRNLMTVPRGDNLSVSIVRLELGVDGNPLDVVRRLESNEWILWSSPNFVHAGEDPRDFIPNDPQYSQQYHHPLMQNHLAWDITLGNPDIIIGVTDDGVLLTHPDLAPNIWVNPGEIPGNGVDDDGNGYIDDINGWNFSGNNNNPNPDLSTADHGTHVAGIAAGVTNNGIGIAGTAGQATIMPLQFYRGGGSWTAAVINETYVYAANNGARIVTTSYNVDGWVGDPVFSAGLQYMYDAGVLHFNSAGNNNQLNPPRQIFDQSLFVASTNSADVRAGSSNYGIGIDVAAPGVSILATILNDSYGTKSGTSMATPNAAGAAALIWGANPTWNRYQVAAQLLYFSDNIDSQNPNFVELLGSGRVNPFRALTNTLPAPQVKFIEGLPTAGSTTSDWNVNSFTVAFDQVMDPSTVNDANNFILREAGADGILGTADDQVFSVTANRVYQVGTNQLTFTITAGNLTPGDYRLEISQELRNPFGTALDGVGNGSAGETFVYPFSLKPETQFLPALGSLIYTQDWMGNISHANQQHQYFIDLSGGETLSVVVTPEQSLSPTIAIRDPMGNLINSSTMIGANAVTSTVLLTVTGRYQISVEGLSNSTGSYSAKAVFNAGISLVDLGGPANDSLQTAQDIESTAVPLGTRNADRLAVIGVIPAVYDVVHYEGFESGSLNSQWSATASNSRGRLRISNQFGTAAGSFAMYLDRSNSTGNTRVQANWQINMSGLTSAILRFSEAAYGDRVHTMPASFSGNSNTDGVAISADGSNWYRVWSPTSSQPSGVWTEHEVDLVAAAATAGIPLNSNFRIRFQQYDNGSIPSRGRGYDEIKILSEAQQTLEKWYAFTLNDGEYASIAGNLISPNSGNLSVQVYNDLGQVLATGTPADNVESFISRFQASNASSSSDTYFVRVLGSSSSNYSVTVTRSAEFDRAPNNSLSSAQSLNGLSGALGFADNSYDYFKFPANSGDLIRFSAHLPRAESGSHPNGLIENNTVFLGMDLFNPSGHLVSSGTLGLNFTADVAGDWFVRIYGTSGRSGEYFLQRDIATRFESGTVTLVGPEIASVAFSQEFVDPIILVSPVSNNHNNLPVIPSITGINPAGFQIYVSDWNTQSEDSLYSFEEVSYLVFERGVNQLPNGLKFVAGSLVIDDAPIITIPFEEPFLGSPVVLVTTMTNSFQTPRVPRVSSITDSSFQIQTQFGEAAFVPEDDQIIVHYLAIEPGRYEFDDFSIEIGKTPNEVTHQPYSLNFLNPFASAPKFFANLQTFNDPDPATLRLIAITNMAATFFVQEEQTYDLEMEHGNEQVGYVAFWRSSHLPFQLGTTLDLSQEQRISKFVWFRENQIVNGMNDDSESLGRIAFERNREADGVPANWVSPVYSVEGVELFGPTNFQLETNASKLKKADSSKIELALLDQFFADIQKFGSANFEISR